MPVPPIPCTSNMLRDPAAGGRAGDRANAIATSSVPGEGEIPEFLQIEAGANEEVPVGIDLRSGDGFEVRFPIEATFGDEAAILGIFGDGGTGEEIAEAGRLNGSDIDVNGGRFFLRQAEQDFGESKIGVCTAE